MKANRGKIHAIEKEGKDVMRISGNPDHFSLRSTAKSKLLELGVKLDRLESLLHNPPSKPNLTDEELKFRWKMLSDIQLRTREVALSLYAFPSPNRSGGLPAADADAKENSTAIKSCCQGTILTLQSTFHVTIVVDCELSENEMLKRHNSDRDGGGGDSAAAVPFTI
ncbi:hypothetical protein CFP56_026176 [Quercus suber]|uniref:Uncharacterized protein n=1 Tax=Quercus suber TaxID=58331 RepID=A0AAW0K327_QUESU